MVSRYLIAWIVLVPLGGCVSADAHQLGEAEEEKASLRVVVDPAPGKLYSLALSGDGRVVAETAIGFGGVRAFVWTDAQGRRDLPVPESGRFVRVNGASRDGTRVVGYGVRGEKNAFLWQSGKGTIALGGRDEEIAFLATLPAEALEDKRP